MNWTKISLVIVGLSIAYLSLKAPSAGVEIHVNDKFGHGLAYFVFTLNLGVLLQKNNCWWAAIIAFGFSALLEYLQGFVPGRTVSSLDLLANASGAVLATLLLLFFYKSLHQILKKLNLLKKFKKIFNFLLI